MKDMDAKNIIDLIIKIIDNVNGEKLNQKK